MEGSVLDRESILKLIRAPQPLVEGYLDLEGQLQPNGFDFTLRELHEYSSVGELGRSASPSTLSEHEVLPFDKSGFLHLAMGAYMVTLNEIVNLPRHIMALARPRSSLLRSGVAVHTAIWDAGYRGRSQALLTVYNPLGYRVAKGARLLQMVFMVLVSPVEEGYQGRFLGENI